LQKVVEMRTDCDQDVILLRVEVDGADATCHTGRRSCFYRRVEDDGGKVSLIIDDNTRRFDPETIYRR
jgi:phosphoribosyl-AMP cyclohydrolase